MTYTHAASGNRGRSQKYRAYVGSEKAPDWLACGPILAFCGAKPIQQRREYRRFVESALGKDEDETGRLLKSSALAVGGEGFVGN